MTIISTSTKHRHGVTLVRATVTNTKATSQTVTVQTQVEGPTWIPRHNGLSASAWTGNRWSAVLRPGESRGLGFVTPGDPTDSPVEIVSTARSTLTETNTEQVISSLEAWSPPTPTLTESK